MLRRTTLAALLMFSSFASAAEPGWVASWTAALHGPSDLSRLAPMLGAVEFEHRTGILCVLSRPLGFVIVGGESVSVVVASR